MTTTDSKTRNRSKASADTPKKAASAARVEGGTVIRRKAAKRRAKPKKQAAPRQILSAKGADKHVLYQLSVQSPEEDMKFLKRVYKSKRGRDAKHFREDFCGTGLFASHWVKRGKEFTAEGFDICPDTIAWGIEHNFAQIGDAAERMTFHVRDVREKSHRKPDLRAAQNFSYFVFKERSELLEYARSVYEDLAKDGVFVMDIYGGPDAMAEETEERKIDEGFMYVWDQHRYWPATGEYKAYIHFQFKDGTEMRRAFTYDWRLWNLTEVVDVLEEAGFPEVETFWEGTDKDGESGNGIYRKSRRGENCDAWVTYIVGYK